MIGVIESGPLAYMGRGVRLPRAIWGYHFIQKHELSADHWTVTAVGTSTFGASSDVENTQLGEVRLLTDVNDNDSVSVCTDNKWIKLTLGAYLRFGFSFKATTGADDDNWEWMFGCATLDTTPWGNANFHTDGVVVGKLDGGNSIGLYTAFNNASSSGYGGTSAMKHNWPNGAAMADALDVQQTFEVAIQMDPTVASAGLITVAYNNDTVYQGYSSTLVNDEVLGWNMSLVNGSAAQRIGLLDYVFVDHARAY